MARIAADREARAVFRLVGEAALCFGTGIEPGVTPDGVIRLDAGASDIEAAARAAHLALHAARGSLLAGPPPGGCRAWLGQAIDEEAEAHALELRVLDRGGAIAPWPFAAYARKASEGEQVRLIRRWLIDHPDGGGGIPGLVRAYAARCEGERRSEAR